MEKFVEKSLAEVSEMTIEEQETYMKAKAEHDAEARKKEIENAIAEAQKNNATKDEIKELEDAKKDIIKELEAFGLKLKSMTDKGVKVGKDRSMTPLKEALLENKEALKGIKENGGKHTVEVDNFAAKASHNPTDIADREQLGEFEPDVSVIPHKRLYMEQLFPQGNASTEYIKYVEQTSAVRDASNVAACASSTSNTKVEFGIRDLQMKKIRDFTDVCIDMMEDYDFVETQIRDLVTSSLQLKKDSDLLLGDGLGANINGVDSYASTFSASALGANYAATVANAQLIDLLVVAGAQIKAFGEENFFMPNVIILNPKDATLMGLLKDNEENYIKAGTVNAAVFRDANGTLFINGMRVVENPNCPENEAYVFDSTKGRYYRRKGLVLEFSYENSTNFEQELVTVKALERGNLQVRNNDANAFMHIADISAGITAITAT
jgi:hypothetical protein